VRNIDPEPWLLRFLVVIAAILNFLVASQVWRSLLLPSDLTFRLPLRGRRHATLTAVASIVLVVFGAVRPESYLIKDGKLTSEYLEFKDNDRM